ncbi:MAG: sigma factor [Planctomycetota bacterium]
MTDPELLACLKTPEWREAVEEIVRRYTDLIFSACLRIARDRELAEDALQATFLVLMRKKETLSPDTVLLGGFISSLNGSSKTPRSRSVGGKNMNGSLQL